MNVKDFLIDNYIWIIVIILITIITIIGFLADKKREEKNKQDNQTPTPDANQQQGNNMGVIPNQGQVQTNQINNNPGINLNNFNSSVQPQNMQPQNQNYNMMNNQMAGPANNQNRTLPTPVEVHPTNNPMSKQQLPNQNNVVSPQPIPNLSNEQNNQNTPIIIPSVIPNSGINGQQMNKQPNNSNQTTMPKQQVNNINNNNMGMVPNFIPNNNNINNNRNNNGNNNTVPNTVNQVKIPQPVNPQPIINNSYNQGMMPQQNMNVPRMQNNPNPTMNFVYGPQNNNQNM